MMQARHLNKEAAQLYISQRAAHCDAAARILEEVNAASSGGDTWHLDLHGLHVDEAVEALANRLAALEALPRRDTAGRHLTVVTGRGSHSAGLEARLPRAVEGYLMNGQYSYRWNNGSLDVAPRSRGASSRVQ